MKTCPYCSEQIQETAKKCRYCGEFLQLSSSESFEKRNKNVITSKNVKNEWLKSFYWTLGIGIAIFLSGFASVQKGGDITALFAGPGVIIASLGYLGIQKRREGRNIYIILEILAGMTLGFFALLSDPKSLFENPVIILGLALFISYYTYPFINTKISNKWGRVVLRIVATLVLLILISMSIATLKNGLAMSSMEREFAEADKALGFTPKR